MAKKINSNPSVMSEIDPLISCEVPHFFIESKTPRHEIILREASLFQFRLLANIEARDDDLEETWLDFKEQWLKLKQEVERYIFNSEN